MSFHSLVCRSEASLIEKPSLGKWHLMTDPVDPFASKTNSSWFNATSFPRVGCFFPVTTLCQNPIVLSACSMLTWVIWSNGDSSSCLHAEPFCFDFVETDNVVWLVSRWGDELSCVITRHIWRFSASSSFVLKKLSATRNPLSTWCQSPSFISKGPGFTSSDLGNFWVSKSPFFQNNWIQE